MPLIILSGYPSSGKTYRATQLATWLRERISSSLPDAPHQALPPSRLTVTHISDHSLGISRSVYAEGEARAEKDARATLYSAVKRELGRETMVICDGLNYIKGFRYQLWCEAKAMGTGCCVLHIGTPITKCREINNRLLEDPNSDGGYPSEVFENLVFRYEEPNGMTRWDSPLFTVLYEDEAPPYEKIWDAMVGSDGKGKVVKPNASTILTPPTPSNYLHDLDKTTQTIIQAILDWQKDHPGEGGGSITLDKGLILELPMTPLGVPQLQRLRRQYIGLNRQNGVAKDRIRGSFVWWLNDNFQN